MPIPKDTMITKNVRASQLAIRPKNALRDKTGLCRGSRMGFITDGKPFFKTLVEF
jgi:hypothetical protein